MPAAVDLRRDVAGENLEDTGLAGQLLAPHLQQGVFGRLALEVEQVVVVQLAERRGRRVTPGRKGGQKVRTCWCPLRFLATKLILAACKDIKIYLHRLQIKSKK